MTLSKTVRVATLNVKPGISSDEDNGDEWPTLHQAIIDHDILIFDGPSWMGQVGSVAKRMLERLDAFLSETDAVAVGFTIPAVATYYWVGETMGKIDFKDLKKTPDKVTEIARMVASNAAHLAVRLKETPCPG